MRVALVHDFLNQAGGAERVLGVLHQMFPAAPIYTSILDRTSLWPALRDAEIRTSWMQRLPGVLRHHRKYLVLYPGAIESFDLRDYDVVISSSSAFAKGARTRPETFHLCYCHTPMRFAWQYAQYVERERLGSMVRAVLPPVVGWLRAWDVRTSRRPDLLVANSTAVAERIRRHYGRPSEIVFPPVETGLYQPTEDRIDAYLVVGRLAPYKRMDVVVEAFNRLGRPLLVIGEGRYRDVLERLAKPNITFLGHQPDAAVAGYYARCRALVCMAEEDFGIAPLEANAAGRPVIAYAAGGALDSVAPGRTGLLFAKQEAECLMEAVERFEAMSWDPVELRQHAEGFSTAVFKERFSQVLAEGLAGCVGGKETIRLREDGHSACPAAEQDEPSATGSAHPMTLCLVTQAFSRGDGQGRVNSEIVRHLARRGHRIIAIGTAIDPDLAREPNVTFRHVPMPRRAPSALLRWALFALRSRRELARTSTPGRVVHLNGAISFYPADLNASHFVHAEWERRLDHAPGHKAASWRRLYQRLVARVGAFCERRAYRSAPRVVAVSDLVRDALVREVGLDPKKIEVISNGVDTAEFRPLGQGESNPLREELGLPADAFILLFVGDAKTNRKNLELPLRAMHRLESRFHLVVAGPVSGGPYPAMATKMSIADRVHFLGVRRDVAGLLRCADAFTLPSHYDPCPLALLEAMASGLPVITTPMVGNSDLVRGGGGGFVLAGAEDEDGLVAALRALGNDPELAGRMGSQARSTMERHRWENMARRYEAAYRRILSERGPWPENGRGRVGQGVASR